jgi:hypothetical protein
MSREQSNKPRRRLQNQAMFIVREHLKVLIGIGLTWACVFILYYGLTHATLDGWAFVFPVFQPGNLLILLSAPMAQSAFYILARKTSWLLNIYLAISVLCCVIGWLHLTNDDGFRGYRFTYWHQGDLLCVQGCDDTWIFSCLVLVQGCILMFFSSVFEGFWDVWRGVMRLLLVAVLLWLLLTSCAILMSM